MIVKIISIIIQVAISFLKEDERMRLKTEVEALLGREESIEDSYEEQQNAQDAANNASSEVEGQGSDDDVFGSNEWNNQDEDTHTTNNN